MDPRVSPENVSYTLLQASLAHSAMSRSILRFEGSLHSDKKALARVEKWRQDLEDAPRRYGDEVVSSSASKITLLLRTRKMLFLLTTFSH